MSIVHSLYVGVTQSGKTTLARFVARGLRKKGARVVVYDPLGTETLGGAWGEGAEIYCDLEPFLDLLHSPEFGNAHVFIDEAHHVLGHEMKENFWLLTQGRHYGMTLHLMTQRPKKVHPDVRSNCGLCFMFRLANSDASEIGADYGFSDIHRISLDKGDFLMLNSGSAAFSRANVFNLVQPVKEKS